MDGAMGTAGAVGTAGESTGAGNLGQQGQGVLSTEQGNGTSINGQNGEGNSEGTQENSNFTDFNMVEEGEEGETTNDSDADGVSLQLYEGEEYSEEDMAEINEYASLAKELGMNENQFNIMFRTIQLRMNREAIAEIDAQIESEKNGLQNLKKQLTLEERTAWQPMARQLVAQFGDETAKAIMLNPNVYRAFLGRNNGEGISIKKANVPKMNYEQALDARTNELREHMGDDSKVSEIIQKYEKNYPDFFKKK